METLSPMCRLIVILVAMSWTRKQIAGAIMRSVKTVEYHLDTTIPRKLGSNDVAFLTRYALRQGWLKLRLVY